ncbi:unnamed protein product [Ectocarpus fasciculatus]
MACLHLAVCAAILCIRRAQSFIIDPSASSSIVTHVSRCQPASLSHRETEPRSKPREDTLPLPISIAVLRDVQLERAVEVVRALYEEGFNMISVTADTKSFSKILRCIPRSFFPDLLLGASSVTTVDEVDAAYACAVNFVSSTSFDPAIVKRTKDLGMVSIPGVSTPAQAASAVQAGGGILKVYPATNVSPNQCRDIVHAIKTSNIPVVISGGVEPDQLQAYFDSGASGFAVGRTLFDPEKSSAEIAGRARTFLLSWPQKRGRHRNVVESEDAGAS